MAEEAQQESTQQEPAPEAPEQETAAPEGGESPDFGEQIESLKGRMDAYEGEQEPEEGSDDLASLLGNLGEDEGEEFEQEGYEDPEMYGDEMGVEPEQFSDAEALDAFLQDKFQQFMDPILQEQEMGRRQTELDAFEKEYPDISEPEMIDKIAEQLAPLVQRTGDKSLYTEPRLVKLAYKAAKADMASAAETPAEEARDQGASLETGAGAAPQAEDDSKDETMERILAAGGGKDAFS